MRARGFGRPEAVSDRAKVQHGDLGAQHLGKAAVDSTGSVTAVDDVGSGDARRVRALGNHRCRSDDRHRPHTAAQHYVCEHSCHNSATAAAGGRTAVTAHAVRCDGVDAHIDAGASRSYIQLPLEPASCPVDPLSEK